MPLTVVVKDTDIPLSQKFMMVGIISLAEHVFVREDTIKFTGLTGTRRV